MWPWHVQVGPVHAAHILLAALVLLTEVAVVVVHLMDGLVVVVVVHLVHLVLPLPSSVLPPLRVVGLVAVVVVGVVGRGPGDPHLGLVAHLVQLGGHRGRALTVGEVRRCWRLRLALLLRLHLSGSEDKDN